MVRVDLDVDALPERLKARDQWVCWREQPRDGKLTKIPVDPGTGEAASTTDDRTWTGFEQARAYMGETPAVAGLGFVFTAVDPFVGVDLDDCRDPDTGDLTDEAREIVERLDSYAEVSPSGTGVHVLLEGELPADRRRSGDVEMYDEARYFTMTGAHLSLTPPDIRERSEALAAVHADVVADQGETDPGSTNAAAVPDSPGEHMGFGPEPSLSDSSAPETADPESEPGSASLDDAELIERASEAANGDKFRRLWRGDTSGYPSHSEADMALCCLLAFWTGGDPQRMDRLFRESGLMRDKWDDVHYADRRTYGEATIQRALRVTSEQYEPAAGTEDGHEDRSAEGSPAEAGTARFRERGDPGGATEPGDTLGSGEDKLATPVPPEPGDYASVAHLREENAVLREQVRKQRARIGVLEAQVSRETTAATASDRVDGSQERLSESVFQRFRTVLLGGDAGPSDDS